MFEPQPVFACYNIYPVCLSYSCGVQQIWGDTMVIISFTSALVLRGRRRKFLLLSSVNQPDKGLDHKIREGETVA